MTVGTRSKRPWVREQQGSSKQRLVIGILHGYLLDGSGSNLWTQSIVRALCRLGATVHLICQEPHPERFDFVAEAIRYDDDLTPTRFLLRTVDYPGICILHKTRLGGVLPVFVGDRYEEHDRVVPMIDLDDRAVEDYVARNAATLDRIVGEHGVSVLLANHTVLMPTVAQRVAEARSIPYAIVPHGSAIEYVVKKDKRFRKLAAAALEGSSRVLALGPELTRRLLELFSGMPGFPGLTDLEEKIIEIPLGVDTDLFRAVSPRTRLARIRRLNTLLRGTGPGKSQGTTVAMRRRLDDSTPREELIRIQKSAATYDAKNPDTDCEVKLSGIAWPKETIVIYMGRLITGKGVHALVAAMPSILQRLPDARLLIVGHGPLRESLESMLWALQGGQRVLFKNIAAWAGELEGTRHSTPMIHVLQYLEELERGGGLNEYFRTARDARITERVIFTGYLTHRELQHLLPCCDLAIMPSLVPESGPLVFLEAMAAGVFPIGIDAAGIGANIDSLSGVLPRDVVDVMRLRGDPRHLVTDLVSHIVEGSTLGRAQAATLRHIAKQHDWTTVGRQLLDILHQMCSQ